MKTPKPSPRILEQRRQARLRELAQTGPLLQGSLVRVPHKSCRHVAHLLTFPVQGKTRSVYVPLALVEEVKQWTRNYRQLKKLVRRISRLSLALIHQHVPAERAARRRRRPALPP
jgi:hypothetical protein